MNLIFGSKGPSAAPRGAEALKPNLHPRRGGRRAVPTVLQMERTECGAACLAMVLAHYGRWMPLEELRVRCGVSRNGTRALNIIRAAETLGMAARGMRARFKRLFELRFPMIVYWNSNHFVVLEGFRNNRVYINDPAQGPRTLTRDEFDADYSQVCSHSFSQAPSFARAAARRRVRCGGLISRLGHARTPLLFVMLATLALIIPGLALPTLLKVFVDDVLIPRSDSLMVPLMIGMGLAACLQAGLTWLQHMCASRAWRPNSPSWLPRGFFMHLFALPITFLPPALCRGHCGTGDVERQGRADDLGRSGDRRGQRAHHGRLWRESCFPTIPPWRLRCSR